jgi:hypothetical protein
VAVRLLLSVACTLKVKPPAVPGVPLSDPLVESVNPGGSVPPITDHV